jgi:hypothetical protein
MIIYGNLRSSLPRALHQRRRLICWFSSAFALRPRVDRRICVGALLAVAEGQTKDPRPAPWITANQTSRKWPEGSQCRGGETSQRSAGSQPLARTQPPKA